VAFFVPTARELSRVSVEMKWHDAVGSTSRSFEALCAAKREEVERLCRLIMEQKRGMQGVVAQVDAASHCAGCGGACCVTGKYHFTPVDLLVYLVASQPLFQPLFGNGVCPYLAASGCLMAPEFRPFNCITFNCELIEERLTGEELSEFYRYERELRRNYQQIRSLFPGRSVDGSLL
jgi:hypothetical protein